MTKLFGLVFMKAENYPLFELADRLIRDLTLNEIDDLMTGRKHLHKNPGKRKVPVPYPGEEGEYPKAGE